MDCNNCGLRRTKFHCEKCLKEHLNQHTAQMEAATTEKNVRVDRAKKGLETMGPARIRRAEKTGSERRLHMIQEELQRLREANDKATKRLLVLRDNHANRRERLDDARRGEIGNTQSEVTRTSVEELQRSSVDMSLSLSRARAGLVQELVEVFDIVEVGGRPSIGGKHGIKGEWNIVGSILPVPGDIRRHAPEQLNATVQHTLQFLGLLTYYLGVKLPFEVFWSGSAPGMGHPSISAGKGGESGGWAKWTEDYNLYLPASVTQSDKDKDKDKESFTTGLTMLLYNVAYLAYTQGVDVGLSQACEVLRNLWAVCCSPELGKGSHGSRTLPLPPPTPSSFPLDFTQLSQAMATSAKPPGRLKHGVKQKMQEILEEDGDWNLV